MDELDEADYNESEHNRLINAVTKLDKTQHIKDPTRNEPTNLNSEFNLIKGANKLDLGNVVKVLENTAHHVQISKKLKKTQDNSKVLPKPLEKPQAERIKRSTGYGEAKKKVGRWDAVVARSRTVDYVSFPIKHVSNKMQPTQDFLSKLKLKSPLELELDEIDPPAPVEEDEDEELSYPMTYEEMVEQRQHMAKMRAQQSFKAAKAKRQSKIKSKKYHRILKKEKLKQQLKEFEELQKTNPEEALSKLEALEKARALERHTLRHKNTGKWAKSKLIRAKYDKETRAQLAEQLAVSRGLTKKAQNEVSSDDDEADVNTGIPDVTLAQDPLNPWMVKQSNKSNVDAEFDFGYKKYLKDKMLKRKVESDSESDEEQNQQEVSERVAATKKDLSAYNTVEEFVLTESIDRIGEKEKTPTVKSVKAKQRKLVEKVEEEKVTLEPVTLKKLLKKQKKARSSLVATSNWAVESIDDKGSSVEETIPKKNINDVFDSLETDIKGQVEKKLKNLRHNIERLERRTRERKDRSKSIEEEKDNLEYLGFKNKKIKPVIDEQLTETTAKTPVAENIDETPVNILKKATEPVPQHSLNALEANIDPSRFIEAKPKYLNTAISEGVNEYDQLDDDEQVVPKVNIEEVFEEDDVVASFRQEKEDEANKDTPQDIDLSLPGWGSWGGKGVKAPKRKKNRFILKAPPKMPRRDENKGDIIIKEYKDPKLSVHKVKEVPFPFTSVKEYEASIRAPLGNTFIPEKAHKLLIRPSVITKAGTIIEPMDEDELLLRKNKIFKNENIIKLLAKK